MEDPYPDPKGADVIQGVVGVEKLRAQFRVVPADTIDCNDYNANEMKAVHFRRLVGEIKEHGMLSGLLLFEKGDGRFEIVDGEHRFLAAREAGITEIPAFVLNRRPTRAEAMQLTVKLNSLRGRWNKTKLKENVRELISLDEPGLQVLAEIDRDVKAQYEALVGSQTKAIEEAAAEAEREKRLLAKAERLVKEALEEGNGSIQRGYLKILDRDTGEEMFFLFEEQSAVVRQAIDYILATTGPMGNPDGNCLELIAADFLAGVGEVMEDVSGQGF